MHTQRPAIGRTTSVSTIASESTRCDKCRKMCMRLRLNNLPSSTNHTPKVPPSRVRVPVHASQSPQMLNSNSSLLLQRLNLRPRCMLPLPVNCIHCPLLVEMHPPEPFRVHKSNTKPRLVRTLIACNLMFTHSPS